MFVPGGEKKTSHHTEPLQVRSVHTDIQLTVTGGRLLAGNNKQLKKECNPDGERKEPTTATNTLHQEEEEGPRIKQEKRVLELKFKIQKLASRLEIDTLWGAEELKSFRSVKLDIAITH
jgi:hypothetical protein